MAKCSFELKKEIVDAYLSGEGSYSYLVEKYKIQQSAMIRRLVNAFQCCGENGLMRSKKIVILSNIKDRW
jgi:transposase